MDSFISFILRVWKLQKIIIKKIDKHLRDFEMKTPRKTVSFLLT